MYPMQGPSGSYEQPAYVATGEVDQSEKHDLGWELIVGVLIPAMGMLAVHYIQHRDPDSETTIKLQSLHVLVKVLQSVAGTLGAWGVQVENYYNETASSLH